MKAIIYSRCSTDENRQDTDVQLKELRRYCEASGWPYDEVSEYGSGYKGEQPKLKEVIEKIRLKHYDVLIVYSMDRFSRETPRKINQLLDTIVYDYGCRFIAIQQGIDSTNELTWNIVRNMFVYFANKFSRDLSQKIKLGMDNAKAKGTKLGRKSKVDAGKIISLHQQGLTLSQIAKQLNYNKGSVHYVLTNTCLLTNQKKEEITNK